MQSIVDVAKVPRSFALWISGICMVISFLRESFPEIESVWMWTDAYRYGLAVTRLSKKTFRCCYCCRGSASLVLPGTTPIAGQSNKQSKWKVEIRLSCWLYRCYSYSLSRWPRAAKWDSNSMRKAIPRFRANGIVYKKTLKIPFLTLIFPALYIQ